MKALSLLELAIGSLLAAVLFPLPAAPLASPRGSGGVANLTGFAPKAGSPSAFSWLQAFPPLILSPWKGFVMQDPLNFSGPKGSLTKGVEVRPLVNSLESVPQRLTPPEVGPRLESKALPLEWLLSPRKDGSLTDRILARIIQAEAHEESLSLKTDYHIAWLTVKWAAEGVPEWSWYHRDPPFVAATGETLHCDPDEVWPHIVAERKYKLGPEYAQCYDENGNWITDADLARREAKEAHAGRKVAATESQAICVHGNPASPRTETLDSPPASNRATGVGDQSPLARTGDGSTEVVGVPKKPSGSVPLEIDEEIA